ncbi:hypothetical protein B0E55_05193 [Rhodococcus sp. 66b]|nr:hypothetical protein B0E55_05193 [Rhodococcus sp. 66b]
MEPACNHVLFAPGSDFSADMPFWGRHQFVGPEPLLSIGTPALRQACWQERISVRVTATSRQVPLFRPERHSRSSNFATGVCSSKPVAPQGLPRSFTRSVPRNSGSSRSSCRARNNCGVTLDRRDSIRRLDSCGSNCAPDIVLRSVPPGIEGCDRHRALVTSVDEHLLELFGYLGGNVLSFEVVVYL